MKNILGLFLILLLLIFTSFTAYFGVLLFDEMIANYTLSTLLIASSLTIFSLLALEFMSLKAKK